jgi:hypothetical protein
VRASTTGCPTSSSSQSHSDGCLRADEAADDGSASVHVGLEDGVGGNAPTLAACLEILDQLIHGAEGDVGTLENFLRTQLGPAPRQLLSRLAAIIRHHDSLHQHAPLDPLVSVTGGLTHEVHPLLDASRRESGKVRLRFTASQREARKADDVGFAASMRSRRPLPPIRMGG